MAAILDVKDMALSTTPVSHISPSDSTSYTSPVYTPSMTSSSSHTPRLSRHGTAAHSGGHTTARAPYDPARWQSLHRAGSSAARSRVALHHQKARTPMRRAAPPPPVLAGAVVVPLTVVPCSADAERQNYELGRYDVRRRRGLGGGGAARAARADVTQDPSASPCGRSASSASRFCFYFCFFLLGVPPTPYAAVLRSILCFSPLHPLLSYIPFVLPPPVFATPSRHLLLTFFSLPSSPTYLLPPLPRPIPSSSPSSLPFPSSHIFGFILFRPLSSLLSFFVLLLMPLSPTGRSHIFALAADVRNVDADAGSEEKEQDADIPYEALHLHAPRSTRLGVFTFGVCFLASAFVCRGWRGLQPRIRRLARRVASAFENGFRSGGVVLGPCHVFLGRAASSSARHHGDSGAGCACHGG
ncbi:hypothetical protein C8J57DRAFT_1525760 [Mycena rebaudengoi]|nr:hypothetical protein C8J57DRAFT_1525760 [Mycena rebaudengoi]